MEDTKNLHDPKDLIPWDLWRGSIFRLWRVFSNSRVGDSFRGRSLPFHRVFETAS